MPEGINPASNVKNVESKTRPIAYSGDNSVKSATSIKFKIMMLIGMFNNNVIAMPNTPDTNPMRIVSALKIRAMSFFRAPNDRMIPISLVRSITDT